MSQYNYSPLPSGSDSIRLLRLMPHKDKTASIQCELFDYSLQNVYGTHLYEALSYVWGNPHEKLPIFIQKDSFDVTVNLHAALLRLRNHSIERILWIDAICIDQANQKEKEHHLQFMGKIYGQANRVVVWLGEAEDNSNQVLEAIRTVAEEEHTNVSYNNQKAVFALLQRAWFERMWILQEIASARQILIMCGPGEIDGYIFCSGLTVLKFFDRDDPDPESLILKGLIRPVIYLIRKAIFRPKYAVSSASGVSLGELIDMYHTREATIQHDKVYALLNMSSDDPSTASLAPNYSIPWKELLQQLVKLVLSEEVSVATWNKREMAVIKSKGFVLGWVSLVEGDGPRYDRQQVNVSFKNTPRSLEGQRKWGAQWTLNSSAKSIRQGDFVCLLQGASKPTIIRTYKDHFAVIIIAVTPQPGVQTDGRYDERQRSLAPMKDSPRDFLLVWTWEKSTVDSQNQAGFETSIEINSIVPECTVTASEKVTRLYNVALILRDTEEEAIQAAGSWNTNLLESVLDRRGANFLVTEEVVKAAAGNRLSGKGVMTLLLKRRGNNMPVTEEVVKAAAGNGLSGKEVMMLLFERRGDDVPVTEEVVKAAAGNTECGKEIIMLLLERRGDDVPVTEEVVKAAAGNTWCGKEVIMLLLNQREDNVLVTEEVVKAAAGNEQSGKEIIMLLLNQSGDEVIVTEEVIKAAAGNWQSGKEITMLLLNHREDNVLVTKETLV